MTKRSNKQTSNDRRRLIGGGRNGAAGVRLRLRRTADRSRSVGVSFGVCRRVRWWIPRVGGYAKGSTRLRLRQRLAQGAVVHHT